MKKYINNIRGAFMKILDKAFKPAIVELRDFFLDVKKSGKKNHLVIAVERNSGYVYRKEFDIFADGIDDERNAFVVERIVKSILWIVGGYKIYIAGSHRVYENIKLYYTDGGLRDFDYHFMSGVYEREVEVVECSYETIPLEKKSSIPAGGNLKGRRIGFDAGGSDRKVSAVIEGESIYSEEVVWFPKLNSDPQYHYDGIYAAMKTAIEKMGGDVDAIGVSSAGIYIDNKAMVASLFIKVAKDDFDRVIKNIYINIVKQLEQELGHEIPLIVANDGDVTALAGAMDLKDNCVLGIAMGTSEAVGYVDANGNLTGWLSELAFVPTDFNKDSMVDEWSLDFGVGCKYFSQDAVIKLAPLAGIELDDNLSLAEKLKFVQKLNEEGHEGANNIFETIGYYLGHTLAYYAEFYEIKHVILLGRVTSGKGGDTILEVAKKTLAEYYPEYSHFNLCMPSEYMRRVGQSIAAASLPENR
jgi:predicted NBD/HSP70 family sugar kinase